MPTREKRIPPEILAQDYYESLHRALRNLYAIYQASGLTQEQIADRLGVTPGLISRRLRGRPNLTLRTLSEMASAMDARAAVEFQRFLDMPNQNYEFALPETPSVTGTSSGSYLIVSDSSEGKQTSTPDNKELVIKKHA